MAALIDHPVLPPGRCYGCTHASPEFGPYWDLYLSSETGERIVLCASCTTTRIAALDVVPRRKLAEAAEFKTQAEDATLLASEFHGTMEAQAQTIARLQGELEGARSELEASQHARQELKQAAARERKAALLAEVAKPKSKAKAEVAGASDNHETKASATP
jgi:hypothetical protein